MQTRKIKIKSIHFGLLCNLAFILACMTPSQPSAWAQSIDSRNITLFDSIITKRFFESAFKNRIKTKFERQEKDGVVGYMGSYQYPNQNKRHFYSCIITVAHSGVLLSEDKYNEARNNTKDEDIQRDFPEFGMRAHRLPGTLGPNGSFFGITFTTTDGKFDINVSLGNLLPNTVKEPSLDIEQTARHISDLYDQKTAAGQPSSLKSP